MVFLVEYSLQAQVFHEEKVQAMEVFSFAADSPYPTALTTIRHLLSTHVPTLQHIPESKK